MSEQFPFAGDAAAAAPSTWDRIVADMDAGDLATVLGAFLGVLGAVLAAVIAATVAVKAYKTQQREVRRQAKATFYAEAVRAVEDYAEAPYRILRRDGSAQARREVTQHISDIKSRISFYSAWMAIHGTDAVATAYDTYVRAAQAEAGREMTAAWRAGPTKKDKDVPIGSPLPRAATDQAQATLLTAMKKDLDG
jgi:hypothetical protein